MKKSTVFILIFLICLLFISGCSENNLEQIEKTTSVKIVSEVVENTENHSNNLPSEERSQENKIVEIVQMIDFDKSEDLDSFDYHLVENDIEYSVEDGKVVFRSGDNGKVIFGFDENFQIGNILHMRVKTYILKGAAGNVYPMFRIGLEPTNLQFLCQNKLPYDFVRNYDSDDTVAYAYFAGKNDIVNIGQWIDIIIYLDKNGLDYRAILCESNKNEKIMHTSISMPQQLYVDRLFPTFFITMECLDQNQIQEDGVILRGMEENINNESKAICIDFIKIAEGSLQKYLEKYVPAYINNKEYIDRALGQKPYSLDELELK